MPRPLSLHNLLSIHPPPANSGPTFSVHEVLFYNSYKNNFDALDPPGAGYARCATIKGAVDHEISQGTADAKAFPQNQLRRTE